MPDKGYHFIVRRQMVAAGSGFTEIQKSIGEISQRMLTITLKTLVRMNLVRRVSYPEIPPRVEYTLTELGRTLIPHIDSIVNWALTNSSALSISPSSPRS